MEETRELSGPREQPAPEPVDPITKLLNLELQDGVVIKTRCKLCNSPLREGAEQMFEDGHSISKIRTWLLENGEVIAISNVRNHLNEHYRSQERMACLREYCDNLAGMLERRRSRLADLECMLQMGFMELARILTLQTGGDFGKEKDRNDMIHKTKRDIRETIDSLLKMESNEAQMESVKQSVLKALSNRIEEAKTPEERKVCIEAMREFSSMLKNM